MSNMNNDIILENLYEEGLEEAEKQGLSDKIAEEYAESYARKKFENMA